MLMFQFLSAYSHNSEIDKFNYEEQSLKKTEYINLVCEKKCEIITDILSEIKLEVIRNPEKAIMLIEDAVDNLDYMKAAITSE